jgi:membrane protease YdiL (CAAX protease family)
MFLISLILVILTYFIDIVGALYYFITILIAFTLWTYVDRQPTEALGFHFASRWWLQLILGILLSSIVLGLIIGIEVLLGWVILEPVFLTQPLWVIAGLVAYFAIWQALVAGAEEFVSRGYIQQNLATRLTIPLAILGSAIMFAVFHVPGIVYRMLPSLAAIVMLANLLLGGIMLGLAFSRTRFLWLPIGLHFGWNYMLYHIAGFGGNGLFEPQNLGPSILTGGTMGPEGGLLGTLAFLFLIGIVWVGTQPSDGQLMHTFERKALLVFAFGFLAVGIPVVLGFLSAGVWVFLVIWIIYAIFFLQIWENRILCSHCPHYNSKGRMLRCHANYGLYKLWKYNPGPMSRSEQVQLVIGVAIMIGFPFPLLVWSQQWFYLIFASFGAIVLGTLLFGWLCLRCVNFSCPFNRVPKEEVDSFLKQHPEMQKAWEEKGYRTG